MNDDISSDSFIQMKNALKEKYLHMQRYFNSGTKSLILEKSSFIMSEYLIINRRRWSFNNV